MERIAIFAALRWECRPVVRRLRQAVRKNVGNRTVWVGAAPNREVWVVKTGVGLERAALVADAVVAGEHFDLVVSTGCAGALAARLEPGHLAFATAVRHAGGGDPWPCDAAAREGLVRAAEGAGLRSCAGPFVCSPTVLASRAQKRAAAADGAIAVDMEGASIAACAAAAGVPFAAVRAILDTADTELADDGAFLDPDTGAVKPLALAGYVARRPSAIAQLLAMQRMMSAAQRALDTFFAAWLGRD